MDVLNTLDVKGELKVGNPGYTSSAPDGYMKGVGNNGTAGSRFQVTANSSDDTRRLWLGTSHTEAAITITEDKVGVGTTTLIPAATKLHLYDSAPEFRIQDGGDKASNASGYVTFYDHDSLMMKIGVDDGGACRISNELSSNLVLETAGTTALTVASDQHSTFSGQVSATHFDSTGVGTANIFLGSVITKPGSNSLGFIVRNDSNGIIGSLLRSSNTTSTLMTDTATINADANVTGSVKCTQNLRRTITTASNSSNTHTCDLRLNDNFAVAAANAATTIALTVASENIGQSGTIVITNPASVGSLSFAALPSYMLTPDSATINFVTTANAVSLISYYVIATDKVLCNYVGNFG